MELFNTAHKVRPYAAIPQVKGQERGVAISTISMSKPLFG